MNGILQNYVLGTDDISIAEIGVFDSVKVKENNYSQVFETLRTTPFLDLENIGIRLNILPDNEKDGDINLLDLLQYYDIEYEPIIRKRMIRVGYSRMKIVEIIRQATRVKSTCIADIYAQWFRNEEFNKMWNVLEPIIFEIQYLIEFYGIKCEEYNGGYPNSMDEIIVVEIDEDIQRKNRVLKFEKFNV